MTWKSSVVDIPLGGGKGGVICNPTEMSPGELERLSRAYVRALGVSSASSRTCPPPDVYTNPQIMAWMMDEYSVMHGEQSFGTITGKPLQLGGSLGRKDATALGGIFCVREAAKRLSFDLKGRKCAIQGYGNVGSPIHQMAQDMLGMKVVAVSDVGGGIYNPDGMSPAAVREHLSRTGHRGRLRRCHRREQRGPARAGRGRLFPAALENVITARNVGRVKAKMVAEMANGPTTPEADKHFFENGVYVIPDILCNAGGVTVSYFEMVQNAYQYYWELDEVNRRLDQKMTSAFHAAHDMSVKYKVHQRLGAVPGGGAPRGGSGAAARLGVTSSLFVPAQRRARVRAMQELRASLPVGPFRSRAGAPLAFPRRVDATSSLRRSPFSGCLSAPSPRRMRTAWPAFRSRRRAPPSREREGASGSRAHAEVPCDGCHADLSGPSSPTPSTPPGGLRAPAMPTRAPAGEVAAREGGGAGDPWHPAARPATGRTRSSPQEPAVLGGAAERPLPLRTLPPGGDRGHAAAHHPPEQHPGELLGEHPRRGPVAEGPDRGAELRFLPHAALHPSPHRPRLLHRPRQHRQGPAPSATP
jgi:glutamate dehydrogenase (NAD(P)+)